jgi:predicted membrane protein
VELVGKAILLIVLAAFLCEAVWETLKMIWDPKYRKADRIGALLLGVAIAMVYGLDIFIILGFAVIWPWVWLKALFGPVLTGILLSRGANFVHDFLKKLLQIAGGDNTSVNPPSG